VAEVYDCREKDAGAPANLTRKRAREKRQVLNLGGLNGRLPMKIHKENGNGA